MLKTQDKSRKPAHIILMPVKGLYPPFQSVGNHIPLTAMDGSKEDGPSSRKPWSQPHETYLQAVTVSAHNWYINKDVISKIQHLAQ